MTNLDTLVRQEAWKPVVGRVGFDVSSVGGMRTYWKQNGPKPSTLTGTPRPMKLNPGKSGYVQVSMRRDVTLVHILVLEAFVGPRPEIEGMKIEARHLNDVRHDNRLENLCWGTQQENIADAKRNGLWKFGEQRKSSQVSDADAVEIRRLYDTGEYFHRELAKMFNVSKGIVQSICSGTSRPHLPLGNRTARKTTTKHVEVMRQRILQGENRKAVAKDYGVSVFSVYRICPVHQLGK